MLLEVAFWLFVLFLSLLLFCSPDLAFTFVLILLYLLSLILIIYCLDLLL